MVCDNNECTQKKLGIDEIGEIDILNVKCLPSVIDDLLFNNNFKLAYHMNKKHWISIVLDDKVDSQKVKELIDKSYEIIY